MAKIGLKFPVAAVINGYGADGKPTYNQGFIIGKAISAEKSIESNDNQLYGDDAIAESDTSFAGGSVKLGVTDFGDNYNESLQIQGKLLGQAVTTVEGGGYRIRRSALTVAPYVGFGFYKTKKHKNKLVYEATWLYKTVFKTPSESTTTKGKSIEWQTPEIEGTVMAVEGFDNDTYEDTALFETEVAARSWLCEKIHINLLTDRTALDSKLAEVEALNPENYTSASWGSFAIIEDDIEKYYLKSYLTQNDAQYIIQALTNGMSHLVERSV